MPAFLGLRDPTFKISVLGPDNNSSIPYPSPIQATLTLWTFKLKSASAVRIAGDDSMPIKYPTVRRLRSAGGALLLAMTGCSADNTGLTMDSTTSPPTDHPDPR